MVRPSFVGLTLRWPGNRRTRDFELCPQCVVFAKSSDPAVTEKVLAAILAEFKALL